MYLTNVEISGIAIILGLPIGFICGLLIARIKTKIYKDPRLTEEAPAIAFVYGVFLFLSWLIFIQYTQPRVETTILGWVLMWGCWALFLLLGISCWTNAKDES